jgi:hypothetical protein
MRGFSLPLPDRYDWTARVTPGLLTLLPALVMAAIWLPTVWTALGALSGLLATCGATYLMAQVARHRGRRLQARFAEDGPELTIALMRHGDPRIDVLTKARYHQALSRQGLDDKDQADLRFRACATWLREATRDQRKFPLLMAENIAYGFRRNLLAMKPIALAILLAALGLNLWALRRVWSGWDETAWKALIVEAFLFGGTVLWAAVINRDFLREASLSYGLRLLACCDTLPKSKGAKKTTKPPKALP